MSLIGGACFIAFYIEFRLFFCGAHFMVAFWSGRGWLKVRVQDLFRLEIHLQLIFVFFIIIKYGWLACAHLGADTCQPVSFWRPCRLFDYPHCQVQSSLTRLILQPVWLDYTFILAKFACLFAIGPVSAQCDCLGIINLWSPLRQVTHASIIHISLATNRR